MTTRRERPKSAPYLDLKNSQRTSKCQVLFFSTVPALGKNEKKIRKFFSNFFLSPVSRIVPKNVKESPLGVFEHPFVCKIEKNEGGPFGDIKKMCEKGLTKPK